MALAISAAEASQSTAELSFLAPLAAAAIAAGPPPPVAALLALPVIGWAIAVAAGVATQWLHGLPLAFGVLQFAVFRLGFSVSRDARLALPGMLLLIVFAVLPVVLVRAEALGAEIAWRLAANVAFGALAAAAARLALPDAVAEPTDPPARTPPVAPSVAAAALLLADLLVAWTNPPGKGALLVSVVVSLRADSVLVEHIVRARFGAALIGGASAWLAWEIIGLAPSLPVLFATTLLIAWCLARRFADGGEGAAMWLKSLNALAILLGEGLSVLFENTEERLGLRIAGVALGLAYGAVVARLLAPRARLRPLAA